MLGKNICTAYENNPADYSTCCNGCCVCCSNCCNCSSGNGSACSAKGRKGSKVLLAMGLGDRIAQSALRFSLCRFTTREEIESTAGKVSEKAEMLVKYQRR